MTLQNANLKKRVMAMVVSGAVAFGGAAAVAPAATADEAVTSQYSQLASNVEQAAIEYNQEQKWDRNAQISGQYWTPMGPGWCIDADLETPKANTAYEVRKLDGTSGFYGFNGDMGGNLKIDPDIQRAAINLTKLMLTDVQQGKYADARTKNAALQALLSNHKETLNLLRGWIKGSGNIHYAGVKPMTAQQFLQWTGFEVRQSYFEQTGQANYYLVKNDEASSRLNVKQGEYVTILLPRSYNVYQDRTIEPTNQRIITIAQPGLEGFEPGVKEGQTTVTEWVTAPATTKTVTETPTHTKTVEVGSPDYIASETVQPTVTKTQYIQPVKQEIATVTQADKTVTETRRPEDSTSTATTTQKLPDITVTKTAPAATVTETVSGEPVYSTVTKTVTPTETVTGAKQTEVTTRTLEPKVETVTETRPAVTQTATVTAAPQTKVVATTVTSTQREEKATTKVVERYFRHFSYAFDFRTGEQTEEIEVKDLKGWDIDFIDDSNGLVEVTKDIREDGTTVLKITPKKEGSGKVRIVVKDGDGNRHEYVINVVNESTKVETTSEVTVNNHYFNVGVSGVNQSIDLPAGWDYEILEGKGLITTELKDGKLNVKVNDGVLKGNVKIEVFEKNDKGEKTGNKNVYEFNIDATSDKYTQTRVIGNANSYKLDIANVEKEPEFISGKELIQSVEKRDGFWIITPKPDANGKAVLKAVDADGKTYNYTLDIKPGANVLVDVETHTINEGTSVDVETSGKDWELEQTGGDEANWEIVKTDEGFKINNKVNGTAIFNLYAPDGNGGRVLVGVYTIAAKPAEATEYEVPEFTQELKDRNTADFKPGNKDNTFEITEGKENATLVKTDDGKFRVMPNPGFDGDIVVEEKSPNGKTVAKWTLQVTPEEIKPQVIPVEDTDTPGIASDEQQLNLKIVEGEELVDRIENGKVYFKQGAKGKVVIHNLNSRDLPFQIWEFNVTPSTPDEDDITLNPNSKLTLTLPEGSDYEVTDESLVDVKKDGNTIIVIPKDGAEGKTQLKIKNDRGVYQIYNITVVPGANGTGGTDGVREQNFKLTQDGTFTITRINKNEIRVEEGEQYVNVVFDEETGKWVLTPKGKDSIGKIVTVVEVDKSGEVVKRHTIEIVAQPTPLKFVEERVVYKRDFNDKIIPGKGNTLHVVRGNDLVTNPIPDSKGQLFIQPTENKTGTIVVEERDSEGNPVRIVEMEVPRTSEGGLTPPAPEANGSRDKGYDITVKGGENSVEVYVCYNDDCTKKKLLEPGKEIEVGEGGKLHVKPGDHLDGGRMILVVPIENGKVNMDEKFILNITQEEQSTTQQGSSELDGKCIASLVGLSAPLLLAIPLGILSQVQIPGLEGVSAQINGAMREANDRIQRGLGIYNEDRAQRAAGFQNAFQGINTEQLGMAAGALGAITVGLFIVDQVLRACGQEEVTSSYQLGEATDSDFLMYGSSGKPSEAAADQSEADQGSSK